jgi:deoxyhypusine synthase
VVPANPYLKGEVINPPPIRRGISVADLVDHHFLAYNAGSLRDGCHVLAKKMLKGRVTVGLAIAGALSPAGLGISSIIPLIRKGFIDWIVSTGANLYHDIHFALGMSLHRGSPLWDDGDLRKKGVVRIYDVVFKYKTLLDTDRLIREVVRGTEFQREMGTAQFHHLLGKYIFALEKKLGLTNRSILSAAYQHGVPLYVPSPGDSSIGMNVAAGWFRGNGPRWDVSRDVNETAAIVYHAKQGRGKSGIFIVGGGAPKNFILQTEPHIQEILGLKHYGHDYFLQITDARPDTGGMSGATPSEAVSWNKVNPKTLPDSVVVYTDSTIALPLVSAYVLSTCPPRPKKKLYRKRETLLDALRANAIKRNHQLKA